MAATRKEPTAPPKARRVRTDQRQVLEWLDFAPEHAGVADAIARAAAEQAVVVGSGRVGRTKLLPLEERAALAARATIRHRHTDYDDRLAELAPYDEDDDYRDVKRAAHDAVDDFLLAHRRPQTRAADPP